MKDMGIREQFMREESAICQIGYLHGKLSNNSTENMTTLVEHHQYTRMSGSQGQIHV